MARYSASVLSQAGQLAGLPAGTTFNGFFAYWAAAAGSGFRLRSAAFSQVTNNVAVPTSQQFSVAVYRMTVLPSGTGLAAAIPGEALEIWTPADPTGGLVVTTAAAAGTTGPTLGTNPVAGPYGLNSQNAWEEAWEGVRELIAAKGAAVGLGFVNIGQTLPANHQIRLDVEIEV